MHAWVKTGAALILAAVTLVLAQGGIRYLRRDPNQFIENIDEPSHFMTGLMIRDYAARAFPSNPIRFAKQYYLHYPKVAFGSWPPLLHLFLAAWLLVLPATRQSALLYMDTLTALLAVVSVWLARRRLPWLPALAVGAAVWLSALVQRLDQVVQADLQYGLFSVLAMALFALWLERPGVWRAAGFGLAVFAAVMTKNNALFLALSVPAAVLLTRSWRLVRRPEIWLAVVPAAAAVAVWQYLTLPFVRNNLSGEATPGLALWPYLGHFARLGWPGLLPFALWAVYRRVWIPFRRKGAEPLDAALFGLLTAPLLFHCLLPHDVNQRYLLPSLPALAIFAAVGFLDLASTRRLAAVAPPVKLAGAALLLLAGVFAKPEPPLPPSGMAEVAARLVTEYPAGQYPAVLVESSFGGEATLIAETAVREPRPGHWLLRGLKILRRKTGTANRQTAVVNEDPASMLDYLKSLPVSLLIVSDEDAEQAPDRAYVARMMRLEPALFRPVMTLPFGAGLPGTIRVYRMGGEASGSFAPGKLPRDMQLWKGL